MYCISYVKKIKQENSLSSLCTISICFFKQLLLQNDLLHVEHAFATSAERRLTPCPSTARRRLASLPQAEGLSLAIVLSKSSQRKHFYLFLPSSSALLLKANIFGFKASVYDLWQCKTTVDNLKYNSVLNIFAKVSPIR